MGFGYTGQQGRRFFFGQGTSGLIGQLQKLGATFFKDYKNSQSTLNADFAAGSDIATFTASRSSSNPAAIVDSNGLVSIVTSSDTARFVGGFYNSSGFTVAPSLLLEGASTNNYTESEDLSDADWAQVSTVATAGEGVAPDGNTTATRLVGTSGSHRTNQTFTASGTDVTNSMWVMRGTGTDQTFRLFNDNADLSSDFTATTDWQRFEFTSNGSASATVYGITRDSSSNDYNLLVWGAQLEETSFPSSYIPTTTAALTRNAEVLTYLTADNFVGGTDGTICLVYRPIMLTDEQGGAAFKELFLVSIDGSNEWKLRYGSNANDRLRQTTISGGTTRNSNSSADPFSSTRYSLHSWTGTYSTTADGSGNKLNQFVDGVLDGTNVNYEVPSGSLPASFSIQPSSNQAMQLVDVVLFNKRLSAAEALQVHNLLGV